MGAAGATCQPAPNNGSAFLSFKSLGVAKRPIRVAVVFMIYILFVIYSLFNNAIPQIEPTATASLQQSPNDTYAEIGGIQTQTHAVVHMGPPKTGSTSIQFQSRNSIKDLNKDGFDMPWVVANKKNGENQMHFATCFLSSKEQEMNKKYPCDNNLLQ